jgi:hypothetical protein
VTLVAGGGIGLALVGVLIVQLRRRKSESDNIHNDEREPTTAITPATSTLLKGPPKRSTQPKPKPAGLKGPPPRSKPVQEEPAVDGAAALDALVPTPPSTEFTIGSTVPEWSGLPAGGEYDYALDQTLYKGEECGVWLMNEDKTFTRIE